MTVFGSICIIFSRTYIIVNEVTYEHSLYLMPLRATP